MTEWIPVTERLPEKDGMYFVVVNNDFSWPKIGEIEEGNWTPYYTIPFPPKSYSVTHWHPYPEMPKKKRWRPEKGENVYGIRSDGKVLSGPWCNIEADNKARDFLGTYKNMSEALTMIDKIKAFVTSEIGEP